MTTTIAAIISDRLRVEILQILTDNGQVCVQDLVEMLHDKKVFVRQPNVSQALRVLRENNFIDYTTHGLYKIYHIKNKDLFIQLQKIMIKYEKETITIRNTTS